MEGPTRRESKGDGVGVMRGGEVWVWWSDVGGDELLSPRRGVCRRLIAPQISIASAPHYAQGLYGVAGGKEPSMQNITTCHFSNWSVM